MSVARGAERLHGNRATKEQIAEGLLAADEEVSDRDLTRTLRRLTDCGQIVQVRRFDAAPMSYVTAGDWDFDRVDLLESDIAQVLRDRVDAIGYEDDEQLKGWLRDAGIEDVGDRELSQAVGHLVHLGHLQSPRADTWEGKGPRPTWLNVPRIRSG